MKKLRMNWVKPSTFRRLLAPLLLIGLWECTSRLFPGWPSPFVVGGILWANLQDPAFQAALIGSMRRMAMPLRSAMRGCRRARTLMWAPWCAHQLSRHGLGAEGESRSGRLSPDQARPGDHLRERLVHRQTGDRSGLGRELLLALIG